MWNAEDKKSRLLFTGHVYLFCCYRLYPTSHFFFCFCIFLPTIFVFDTHKQKLVQITLFHVTGSLLYCDPEGKVVGAEDVFTKLELAKKHYAKVGLGEDFVQQFVR